MKKLFFLLLLIVSGQCFSQSDTITPEIFKWSIYREISPAQMPVTIPGLQLNKWPDCGTPVPYEDISDWKTVDTLGDYFTSKRDVIILSNNYKWVEDEWKVDNRWLTATTLESNPCKTTSILYTQYRIHNVSGIRQMRTKAKGTRYEEKPKSEYELVVEGFKKVKSLAN